MSLTFSRLQSDISQRIDLFTATAERIPDSTYIDPFGWNIPVSNPIYLRLETTGARESAL